jgi:diketogulonate reductase-like aldo/keto reductase
LPWRKGTILCPDDEANLEDTWKTMESLVDKGLTRYIGLSNFDESNISRILKVCRIKPYANQLEIHPRLAQVKLVEFNKKNGINVVAWSPLGKCTYLEDHPILRNLAKDKGRTIPQIVLRWHLQRGISSIPRSSKTSRIVANASIFDFELSDKELHDINRLDENRRLTRDWIGVFDTTPRFPYKYIGLVVSWLFRFIFYIFPNKVDLHGNPK